ncbi:MAG: hypothetical protein R3F43_02755 [bacterium]
MSARAVWGWLRRTSRPALSLVEALVRDPRVGTRQRLLTTATRGTSAAGMIRVAGPDPFLRPGPAALATIHQLIYALKASLDVGGGRARPADAGAGGGGRAWWRPAPSCTWSHPTGPPASWTARSLDCALDALDAAPWVGAAGGP